MTYRHWLLTGDEPRATAETEFEREFLAAVRELPLPEQRRFRGDARKMLRDGRARLMRELLDVFKTLSPEHREAVIAEARRLAGNGCKAAAANAGGEPA